MIRDSTHNAKLKIDKLLNEVPDCLRPCVEQWLFDMESSPIVYRKPLRKCSVRNNLLYFLVQIVPFLDGDIKNLHKATVKAICKFLPKQYSSRRNTLMSARSLATSLHHHKLIDQKVIDDLEKIKVVPMQEPNRSSITEQDFNRIIQHIRESSVRNYSKILNEVIITTLYATGVRASELINIKLASVNLQERELSIHNAKGGKSNTLGISELLSKCLKNYIEHHRPECGTPQLFVLADGSSISIDRLLKKVKSITTPLGLPGGCHQFRRGCAKYLASKNLHVSQIQKVLNHSSVNTTMMYLQVSQQEVIDLMKSL